jgi:hypothetical protein
LRDFKNSSKSANSDPSEDGKQAINNQMKRFRNQSGHELLFLGNKGRQSVNQTKERFNEEKCRISIVINSKNDRADRIDHWTK